MAKVIEPCRCANPERVTVYRSGIYRWTALVCRDCLREWTVREIMAAEPSDIVSTDEIIDAHAILIREDVTLSELLGGANGKG